MGSEAVDYTMTGAASARTLPPAIEAHQLAVEGRSGRLSYYHAGAGAGPPVLLIHSINAAASAFEVRPIFDHLRGRRATYAVDLPGFGFSERSRRRYDLQLFTTAVLDMLDVIDREHPDAPVDAIAISLSAEFLARAAAEHPARFRRLVLINPTGFSARTPTDGSIPPETSREVPGMHALLAAPLWRRQLYGLLTRRGVIRYFLGRTYGSDEVDEDMVDYDFLTAHQPGAEWAPLAFLSGRLFSRDIRRVYEQLQMPVWVPHGIRGDFADFSQKEWAEARENWSFTAFASGALPHFERPLEFCAELDAFLG